MPSVRTPACPYSTRDATRYAAAVEIRSSINCFSSLLTILSVGVSNYKVKDLESLKGEVPSVNQCLMSVSLVRVTMFYGRSLSLPPLPSLAA